MRAGDRRGTTTATAMTATMSKLLLLTATFSAAANAALILDIPDEWEKESN